MGRYSIAIAAVALGKCALSATAAHAGSLDTPNAFAAGSPAVADEVNENFAAVEAAVNDNDTRVAELEAALAAALEAAETSRRDFRARLDALESFMSSVERNITFETDNQGHPAVVFSGVNVHINNGEGKSESVNGVGNLIIGYDEPGEDGASICSDGRFDNADDCSLAGGVFAAVHKSGSHVLVIGPAHNYSRAVGVVTGNTNTVNGDFSFAAGTSNRASGESSAVTGGTGGIASGDFSSVSGGFTNHASGEGSSVKGGTFNTASGGSSSVSGGLGNLASGPLSSVSGGNSNGATGSISSVSGGATNEAAGANSSVSGGSNRTADNEFDWVAGTLQEDE